VLAELLLGGWGVIGGWFVLMCLSAGAAWLGGEGGLGRRDWLRWDYEEGGGDRDG
jgi:hypothetical protein